MKKNILCSAAVLAALSLTACSKQSSSQDKQASQISSKVVKKASSSSKSESSQASSSNSASTSSSSSSQQTTLWNSQKSQQLASFMANWGAGMKQKYVSYTPSSPVDFYGIKAPADQLSGKYPVSVDDVNNEVAVKWSTTGQEAQNTYLIVACYSDATSARYADKHLYFFTIYNGKPVVLVTMQNQGNARNNLGFRETENVNLKNGFNKIVGTSSSANSNTATDNGSAGLPVSDDQAVQAFYTFLRQHEEGDDIYNSFKQDEIQLLFFHDVSGKNVASDVNKAVTRTFPKNTYEVRAQPHAEGQVHFQRISDDTIRVFNVPDAFQDDRLTKNSAWAVAQANNYMDHPKVMKLSPADSTMLNLMKSKLTH
ncbi:DUF4767 domain-containing protein [Lactobacillus delbrueckii]|uniref:DUF4767 domain-containing protein n=1 Tax=Lactobacillus delbrueckii TaxID=1584 RepID=UPI001E4E6916|nr:DUF4767 domain-containing protein [Lactobacillus delbrueckii]MCD5486676.1 DUF4767 domain-containing protein [Lactobacillus delbrueckii subsp. lactis]